jgi:hypothetical protein
MPSIGIEDQHGTTVGSSRLQQRLLFIAKLEDIELLHRFSSPRLHGRPEEKEQATQKIEACDDNIPYLWSCI